jgi:heme exporter protein A
MVEVHGLVKAYGATVALRGVNLTAASGSILTILGHNGSGKTTLLRVLATLTRPTAGRGQIAGYDIVRERPAVRQMIGLVGHGSQLYDDLTALENLGFAAALAGTGAGRDRLAGLLARVGLEGHADARVRELSSGMRRRLALARVMVGEPRVLLLDEPFAGLDQESTKRLEDHLHAFRAEGGTVVLVTHSLTRGLAVADRVVILAAGRVAADAAREDLSPERLQRLYAGATEGVG